MRQETTLSSTINSLQQLANSEDWHKRENAGFTLRDIMEQYFDETMKLTEGWVSHPSDRVRRAVCLACMQRKRHTTPPRVQKILHRLEKLIEDDAIYVRKCCGSFVVGYLGYTYPLLTLPWLIEQTKKCDLNVRTNIAKAFSQALGGRHPDAGLSILEILASDERHRVRSAVVASVRNILKRGGVSKEDIKRRFPELYEQVVRK